MLILESLKFQRIKVNLRPNERWGPSRKEEEDEQEVVVSAEKDPDGLWNTHVNDVRAVENHSYADSDIPPPYSTRL